MMATRGSGGRQGAVQKCIYHPLWCNEMRKPTLQLPQGAKWMRVSLFDTAGPAPDAQASESGYH